MDEKYGIMDYLWRQKQAGRIRHLGFSAHGRYETLKRFLEAYGDRMEFCQIQLNYLDWKLQDAKAKVELLNEYKIPIWVMEPLRGGKLATLSQENEAKLKALRPDEETPAWAFRFLQSVPGVTMVLSGMSDMEQIRKNIATYSEHKPLSEKEWDALSEVRTVCWIFCHVQPAVTVFPTARRDWTFPHCCLCIMRRDSSTD